ncbi:MAG TPA: AI-2E family transporter [Anaerolineales bacterium]|nr:AI-2E family transporter [Anaerolineales bacterium]
MQYTWSTRFRYLMFTFMVIVLILFLWYVRVAVTPLVISALIAYVLNPVADWLADRTRWSRRAAVAVVFWAALLLILASPALFLPVIFSQAQTLIADLDALLVHLEEFLAQDFILLGQLISPDQFIPDIPELFSGAFAGITVDAFHFIESITKNLLWLLVILAATYYLLQDWDKLRDWMFSIAPAGSRDDVKRIYAAIKEVWRGYLRGNLTLMTVTGVLFTIAWIAIGVPGAIVLGIIAGLLTIIPDLGPAIAALLAVLVALVEGSTYLPVSNLVFTVIVLAVYLVLINVKNILIRPRIFGRSVHMHDGIVFIAIVAAVVIQGVLGALVVIPVLASGAVIGRYIWQRILGEEPFPLETAIGKEVEGGQGS